MKLLNLLLNFALVIFAGVLLSSATGIDAKACVAGVTVASLVPKSAVSLYAIAGFDLAEINAVLGDYMRVITPDIYTRVFQAIELEREMTPMAGIQDEWAARTADVSDILQAYQDDFTPQGEAAFSSRINKVFQIKADIALKGLDNLYRSWVGELAVEGLDRAEWPFVRFIVDRLIVPKMIEELNTASWSGSFVAPGVGVPGAFINMMDGLGTIIQDEITATNITPIVTPVPMPTNMVDLVEDFVQDMPQVYRDQPGIIYMSRTNAKNYFYDYRGKFGGNNNYTGNEDLQVDGTAKVVRGINSMGASNNVWTTTPGNLIKMFDTIEEPNAFEVDKDKRDLCLFTDFKRGYGWKRTDEIFTNGQA